MTSDIQGFGEKRYNRGRNGLCCTRISSGRFPDATGSQTRAWRIFHPFWMKQKELKNSSCHFPTSGTTCLASFGFCNIAKHSLIHSRRRTAIHSGPVPRFCELWPLISGGWGKRGTTGAAAGSVVPEFLRGISGCDQPSDLVWEKDGVHLQNLQDSLAVIKSSLTINTSRAPGEMPDTRIFMQTGLQEIPIENSGLQRANRLSQTIRPTSNPPEKISGKILQ